MYTEQKISATMRERKHISFDLELKSIDASGRFAGYASIFDVVDNQRDIMLRGAFSVTLRKRRGEIKLLWQHQQDEPIGIIERAFEDVYGLYIEGKLLLDLQRAKEAKALLASGAIKGLSIASFRMTFRLGEKIMKDLYHNVLVTQHVNPVVATTTKTSTAIDLQGYNNVGVVFALGASGDTLSGSVYWTLKLQHSDDDSSYTDVASTDVFGGTTSVVVDSSSEDETSYSFGYIGNKRYLKAVATPTGTHTNGTPMGVLALRGAASYSPVV